MSGTLIVAGASLAGLATVRAARTQGYEGRIVVIGDEDRAPYDRPPLSKQFLDGSMSEADLALEDPRESLEAEWHLGRRAVGLDASTRTLLLGDGTRLEADHVVIATGARARRLPIQGSDLEGIVTLRTMEDALALKAAIAPGVPMVVVGAGFIGAEVASTAAKLGADVTVLEAMPVPLAGPLGATLGAVVGRLHERHGVRLRTGIAISRFVGRERVTGVELADGSVVAADVVVVGVGAVPNTEWLADTGLELANGVTCDARGATGIPHVSAVGDCAAWYDPAAGQHRRVEHWTGALERPAIAVSHLLGTGVDAGTPAPPYFWSDQYGSRLQFVGTSVDADEITFEVGDAEADSFLAVYRVEGQPIGALGMNCPRPFTKFRRELTRTLSERTARLSATP